MADNSNCDGARAWQYHNAADALLHQRIQTLVASQALFMVPFAIVSAGGNGNEINNIIKWLLILIPVSSIIISLVFMSSNISILKKINYIKNKFLIRDEVYVGYMLREYVKDPKKLSGGFVSLFLPVGIPIIIIAFWAILVIVMVVSECDRLPFEVCC